MCSKIMQYLCIYIYNIYITIYIYIIYIIHIYMRYIYYIHIYMHDTHTRTHVCVSLCVLHIYI